MPEIILVTHYDPTPVGHGGHHRSYQILNDLTSEFPAHQIETLFTPVDSNLVPNPARRFMWKSFTASTRLLHRLALPLVYLARLGDISGTLALTRPIERWGFTLKFKGLLEQYKRFIASEGVKVCLIDHPRFAPFLALNQRLKIPTILCMHNLEAFDSFLYSRWNDREAIETGLAFADEYRVMRGCDSCLTISLTETHLVHGFGLSAFYYPYRPVETIRRSLLKCRDQRNLLASRELSQAPSQERVLLLLGSYLHRTTAEGIDWFIEQVTRSGWRPHGKTRLVVAGIGTERLLQKYQLPDWFDVRGWVAQEELDDLLQVVAAVLIPQRLGFGALTRLSELSCAGVPVIVSRHPTHALDLPPGIDVVDSEEDWQMAMQAMVESPVGISCSLDEYLGWESRNAPVALKQAISRFL